MHRRTLLCAAMAGALLLPACGSKKTAEEASRIHKMGETVQVGPLIYTVSHTEWQDQLGEGAGAKLPKHRFLIVQLSVTNSGVRNAVIPTAEIVGPRGETYPEFAEAEGVDEWMGPLRSLDPAQTEHGKIVFDVPAGSYRLRVAEPGDLEEQKRALVELPFQAPYSPIPGSSVVPGSSAAGPR